MSVSSGGSWRHSFILGLGTFFITLTLVLFSEIFLRSVVLFLGIILLILIIFIGILADIIGIAATAASESPFHAKASKKILGAKQSVTLVRNADIVASFCNDVIGDICGTVSGAIGAAIVLRVITIQPTWDKVLFGALLTGAIAALTVGGKAYGKSIAINKADDIIFKVGQSFAQFEELFGITILDNKRKNGTGR